MDSAKELMERQFKLIVLELLSLIVNLLVLIILKKHPSREEYILIKNIIHKAVVYDQKYFRGEKVDE